MFEVYNLYALQTIICFIWRLFSAILAERAHTGLPVWSQECADKIVDNGIYANAHSQESQNLRVIWLVHAVTFVLSSEIQVIQVYVLQIF